jgi:hypothetical protein
MLFDPNESQTLLSVLNAEKHDLYNSNGGMNIEDLEKYCIELGLDIGKCGKLSRKELAKRILAQYQKQSYLYQKQSKVALMVQLMANHFTVSEADLRKLTCNDASNQQWAAELLLQPCPLQTTPQPVPMPDLGTVSLSDIVKMAAHIDRSIDILRDMKLSV